MLSEGSNVTECSHSRAANTFTSQVFPGTSVTMSSWDQPDVHSVYWILSSQFLNAQRRQ